MMACCASGNRGHHRTGPPPRGSLQAALSQLKLSDLRKRAVDCGISPAQLDTCCDAADPRQALIAALLVLEADGPPAATAAPGQGADEGDEGCEELDGLRRELAGLKLSALRRRAGTLGLSAAELDAADDSDAPVEEFTKLILQKSEVAWLQGGAAAAPSEAPEPEVEAEPQPQPPPPLVQEQEQAQQQQSPPPPPPDAEVLPFGESLQQGDFSSLRRWLDHAVGILDTRVAGVSRKQRNGLAEAVEQVTDSLDASGASCLSSRHNDPAVDQIERLGLQLMGVGLDGSAKKADLPPIEELVRLLGGLLVTQEERLATMFAAGGAEANKVLEAALEHTLHCCDSLDRKDIKRQERAALADSVEVLLESSVGPLAAALAGGADCSDSVVRMVAQLQNSVPQDPAVILAARQFVDTVTEMLDDDSSSDFDDTKEVEGEAAAAQRHDEMDKSAAEKKKALLAELSLLTLRELRKRAIAAGVDADDLEDARDGDDPKAEVSGLIIEREVDAAVMGLSADQRKDALLAELSMLSLRDLRKRAVAAGVDGDDLEDARDGDDPKGEISALIAQKEIVDGGASVAESVAEKRKALLAELALLSLRELRKRAIAAGVDADDLEDARDGDDPKAEVSGLIIEREVDAAVMGLSADQRKDALLAELSMLSLRDLRKRAVAAGVDGDDLEDARDGDDPKGEISALIAQKELELSAKTKAPPPLVRHRSHHGVIPAPVQPTSLQSKSLLENSAPTDAGVVTSSASASSAAAAATLDMRSKHVMISYQWDAQSFVKRVRGSIHATGIKTWMDITGGMGSDIYQSMADGVQNAAVVLAFMTQRYQESDNCKLELKFAKQSGIPVIPIMLEDGGWKPTDWLGIVTAGSVWTPLYDDEDYDAGVAKLTAMIKRVVQDADELAYDVGNDVGTVSKDELQDELQRLRAEIMESAPGNNPKAGAANNEQSAAQDAEAEAAWQRDGAEVPRGVPTLPANFVSANTFTISASNAVVFARHAADPESTTLQRSTQAILQLKQLLLSPDSKTKVGFFGQGGIGKTVTSAALLRDPAVRKRFRKIVWVPMGQAPVVEKLQSSVYAQLTESELAPELSKDERRASLEAAMRLKVPVLLVMDDLWDQNEAAVAELDLLDREDGGGSKLLVSTRIRNLLTDADAVEVGLPTVEESVRIVMAAADMDLDQTPPADAAKVAELCDRLPLSLGIAGRLIRELEIGSDWSGVSDILDDELRGSETAGTEQKIIAASLSKLSGGSKEKQSIVQLFQLFGRVPEDTVAPLETLALMYAAVYKQGAQKVTVLHLRKWLRQLINRSLVLGTVDR
eukprot:SAG22_NODE_247_length_13918_cov_7.885375_7_plen_1317_part_00